MMTAKQHINALQTVIDAGDLEQRCQNLCSSGEYGLALMLRFIRIESCMKLYMYESKGCEKFISELNLKGSWGFVKTLKDIDSEKYSRLMDTKIRSVRKYRHETAHQGAKLDKATYADLSPLTDWAFSILYPRVPRFQLDTSKNRPFAG